MASVTVPTDLRVSDAVRLTLYQHDYEVVCPDERDGQDAYEHAERGRCMLCGSKLGEETVVLVAPGGIIGVWCEGECLTDQTVIGWLSEILAEMTAKYVGGEDE